MVAIRSLLALLALVVATGTVAVAMGMPLVDGATGLLGIPGVVLAAFSLAAWSLGRVSRQG